MPRVERGKGMRAGMEFNTRMGRMMREHGLNGPTLAAITLFCVYLLSLPPKWATLHISGFLLVLAILYAPRDIWRSRAMRAYVLVTCAWLVPVALAALWQNLAGLETATTWPELFRLVLRMLGIGMGLIVLLHRGWLTLQAATVAILSVLVLNLVAGYVELALVDASFLEGWRAFRMQGMVFNPNPFGTFMALAIVLSAGLLISGQRSPLLWVILLAAMPALWASGSRGAILTALVGVTLLFLPPGRKGFVMLATGALAAGVLLFVYTFAEYKYSEGDVLRAEAAVFSIEKALEAPLHGWGKEAFSMLPGKPDVNAPHNMLLDLALTSGLVAALGWLLSLFWLLHALMRMEAVSSRIMLAMLVAAVVAGVLEYSLLNSTHFRGIWVLVTALACWLLMAPATVERNTGNRVRAPTHG